MDEKITILIEGTILTHHRNNNSYKSGIYYVAKNITDYLYKRPDVNLKLFFQQPGFITLQQAQECFHGSYLGECVDLSNVKIGQDSLALILFHQPALNELSTINNLKTFQVIHDFAFHCCPEMKQFTQSTDNFDFEKRIINSINHSSHVLCVSENTKKDLISLTNLNPENVGVFHPAIKTEIRNQTISNYNINNLKSELNIPRDSLYILVLSNIGARKNYQTVFSVFDQVIETNPGIDIFLVVVGAVHGNSEINYINSLSLKNKHRVRFTGYVPDEYIRYLYESAICLIFPSFYEGFGLPLVEAMSFGTPVVASNRGSIPEVVGPDIETFDAYDVNGMAQKIVKWCKDPEQRERDAKIAYERSKVFDWELAVDKIVRFIKSKQ